MEVASLTAFRYHPERFFDWLRPLADGMLRAGPNAAHRALAEMEQAGFLKTVITQNIDNLHQRAGSKNVIEIHGTMRTLSCYHCDSHYPMDRFLSTFIRNREMPLCPECNNILKPDIVMYQEMLPEKAWTEAESACNRADLMLIVGSTLEVMPVGGLPLILLNHRCPLIINTLSSTYLDSSAALLLREDAAQVLPLIWERLRYETGTQAPTA